MSNIYVRSSFDIDNPPPLTAEEAAQLERLATKRDADIDTGDILESDLADAMPFRDSSFYRRVKRSTTVRIDADVLHWLKAKGKGYQTRLNAILREAMLREVS